MSARLSVCCLTGDPVSRVAALLMPFRELADELVVGFDDRAEGPRVHEYEQLADRVLPVRFDFTERHLDELHRACSGDWILRVDTDEVPSAGLLRALPGLLGDPAIRQYRIPRRWLYPDPNHWVDELPWWPDFQIRLVRNEESLAFAGELHTSADPLLPTRYLDTPLYHLDCVLTTQAARREKARHYESIRPGLRGLRALPVNAAYEPEVFASMPPRPVPLEDRARIATVLDSTSAPRRAGASQPPAPAEELEAEPQRPRVRTGPGADAAIEPFGRDHRLVVGLRSAIHLRVTNHSDVEWPADGAPGPRIRLGYRWLAPDGTPVVEEAAGTPFPCAVAPGQSAIAPLTVVPPSRPGTWILEVDIVHELVRWYRCELRLAVDVLQRPAGPRVVFMGGWSAHRHVGDDAILRAHLRELERRVPSADAVVLADLPDPVSARFGVQAAAGVYAYLHEGITRRTDRRRAVMLMTARTLRLIRHARSLRRGREPGPLHPTAAELLETLSHADLVVGASAGSLCSRYSLEALWPQAAMALAAGALGVPVQLSRLTVGPFTGIADRLVGVALFQLADEISIRDRRYSRRELRHLATFGSRVRETADAAWHLASAPSSVIDRALREQGIPPDEPLAVLSGHGPDVSAITDQLGAVAGALAENHGLRSLFIPMVTGAAANDEEVARRLASLHGGRLSVLGPLPPDDVIAGIARRARIAIGTRYHLAVFAASGGVPAVGLHTDESERKLRGLSDFAGDLVTSLPADTPAADLAAAAGRQLGRASGTRDLWLGSSSGASWFGPLERRRGVRSGRAPAPPEVDPRVEGSDGGVEIAEVALAANPDALDDLGRFYRDELRIAQAQRSDGDLALRIGPAGLRFRPAGGAGQPFYHFALLVPGDRFQAARDWLAGHAELLPRPDSPATVFDFDAWQAQACYCHDPAGNIVELIAHRGVAERRESSGRFSAEELAGISELGVVVPSPARAAELLRSELGLELWDGAVDERGGLGFVGSKAQTLILCAPGRGWLPTGRPASIHPVHVTLTGARPGEVGVPRTPHRIRVSSRSGP